MYLLDTDVVIWYLRDRRDITRVVSGLGRDEWLGISVLTRLEVSRGARQSETAAADEFLASLFGYDVTRVVADRASDFIRSYRRQGITLDLIDAVIAATAVVNELILVTLNRRHYPMPELELYPLYTTR
ncbi:MAG: type II toxin-antitoxin system VapC family toxin [Chloroflexi bacterium]|nr:type II toxin-antitoxin system VapC family toxin [Chloroflexota bacterium]